ncbi:substrate-binding domain-containing protein [Williamsia sterculiae]|uniref:Extracellular solute-binding protein n=1 Tax=Williamsia sterculiae TaxID=1344003 RepID=A0A1N7H2V2_9NOCA|nr:substrate-binding domain-containing protein [Williamsia sterculiae]SIS19165.1 extracellular solute-binding protein [Williamsia sterculiae]
MGKHRSSGTARRGVSRGLLVAIVAVVVLVVAGVLWAQLGDRITDQGNADADRCVKGPQTVSVAVAPALADPLSSIATTYNATAPKARDHCITVEVRPTDPKVTLDALAGNWDQASMGSFPAAWIPPSSLWSAQLASTRAGVVAGSPESLTTSPVVLAVSREFASTAGSKVAWLDLPTLQTRDNALDALGLRGWGSLRMAVPGGPESDAGLLAAQAVAAAVSRSTTGPLSGADVGSPRVTTTLRDLVRRAPAAPNGTISGAVKAIGSGTPASGAVHAVATTEQGLYALTRADPALDVAEILPSGATPIADYPVVTLTGSHVDATAGDAVTDFVTFLRRAEQQKTLASDGFRAAAPLPQSTAAVTFPAVDTPLAAPEAAAAAALTRIVDR